MSSEANERQVGGSHYHDNTGVCPVCGAPIQHWDFAAKLPYLVGQATKYILRFRSKNGLEDLKKAQHFLQKMIEVYYPAPKPPPTAVPSVLDPHDVQRSINEGS